MMFRPLDTVQSGFGAPVPTRRRRGLAGNQDRATLDD